jgi:anti-sigma-K factor RskA
VKGVTVLSEEKSLLAAELALGLLTPEDHARALRAAEADPELREELARWQHRLVPYLEPAPEVSPPARSFAAIEARLFEEPKPQSLWARIMAPELRGWLMLAVLAKLGVLVLVAYALFSP